MPELPEVETTVRGIARLAKGLTITDVWTDYNSPFHTGKDNIKDPRFFTRFKKEVSGTRIIGTRRRAKNVLIDLSNKKTILIHMKMTGHILYGKYHFENFEDSPKKEWLPIASESEALRDPFNRFIHLVFFLSNKKHLAFSDMRKFAKVTVFDTSATPDDLAGLGPEPLEKDFTFISFQKRLALRPNGKIKQVLMDQSIIAGIGNIYSDEILWKADTHPLSITKKIPSASLKKIYTAMKEILTRSISLGGDSMSDFRDLDGKKGGFHPYHNAYMQHGKKCNKKSCKGTIRKIRVGSRSAHFCDTHQIRY